MQLSDWELVQKCQGGGAAAFQELVARYYQKVYMVVLGILNHPDDALEVSQEVFLRAYRKIKGFKGGSAFYTWLYRIAVNLSIDFQRRQKRAPMELRESMDQVVEEQDEPSHDPVWELQMRELGEKLNSAIDELTPDHRAVVILRTIEGLSYRDIGEILGCSEGTVMSRLHYARKKLQEKLKSYL